MNADGVAISNLKQQPGFTAAVAERVWKAWWEWKGTPLSQITVLVDDNLTAETLPFALVAHQGDTFLGTASVIVSDCEERPMLSPWVAAVWVEPDVRGTGIGRAIVLEAVKGTLALGFDSVYLCSRPERRSFYAGMGWQVFEEDVDGEGLIVFRMDRITA